MIAIGCDHGGYELKEADLTMLGRASSVKVTKDNTTIVDGYGDKKAIENMNKLLTIDTTKGIIKV